MQPVTKIFLSLPAFFSSAMARMFSMASSFALERKPQVLTTAASQPSGDGQSSMPTSRHRAIICSQLTIFFAQPSEIK